MCVALHEWRMGVVIEHIVLCLEVTVTRYTFRLSSINLMVNEGVVHKVCHTYA